MRQLITLFFLLISIKTFSQNPVIKIDIPKGPAPWNNLNLNNAEENFQFAIVTDRTGGHRPGVFLDGILKLNLLQPEFVMSVGDLIEGYTTDTTRLNEEWKEFNGFIDSLDELKTMIATQDKDAIYQFFQQAKLLRDKNLNK